MNTSVRKDQMGRSPQITRLGLGLHKLYGHDFTDEPPRSDRLEGRRAKEIPIFQANKFMSRRGLS